MSMTSKKKLVFILEDDHNLCAILVRTFEEHGFATESFGLIRNFERRLSQVRPAICLVDMRLPDGEGLDVAVRRLRGENVPVIIISGVWTEVTDRVLGLEMGADDYLIKPFSPREAVARARAVLRRAEGSSGQSSEIATFLGWTVDFGSHKLQEPDGTEVELSTSEVRLLHTLMSMPQRVLTREALMDGDGTSAKAAFDRSIDVRISRLRQKLGEDPRNPRIIKTIYGTGYMFAAKVEWLEGHLS
ncbi:MAG: response regulator transcription factor [Rhodobacteraceae bacterium]|nr:response regulator transcription factor [Paracoccaceae bacterium]